MLEIYDAFGCFPKNITNNKKDLYELFTSTCNGKVALTLRIENNIIRKSCICPAAILDQIRQLSLVDVTIPTECPVNRTVNRRRNCFEVTCADWKKHFSFFGYGDMEPLVNFLTKHVEESS